VDPIFFKFLFITFVNNRAPMVERGRTKNQTRTSNAKIVLEYRMILKCEVD